MRLGMDVDPVALRRFREARCLTHEELAELVWASPLEAAAWEAGTVRVPPEQARRLRERDTVDRRKALAASAALPGCPWADAHAPGLHATLLDDASSFYRLGPEARAHVDGCPACARVRGLGRGLARVKPDPGLGTDLRESLEHWFDTAPRTVLYPLLFGGGTVLAAGCALLWDRLSGGLAERAWSSWAAILWWSGLAFTLAAGLLLLAGAAGVLPGRWSTRNAGDDPAGAGRGQAGPARLAPPDPLQDAADTPPLRAEPAPRSAPPG